MKRKLMVMIMLVSLLVTGCGKKDTDAYKFKEEYEALNGTESYGYELRELELPDESPIVYKTAEEIVKAMDNEETFVVYFGFASCPWCRSMIETLLTEAEDKGIESIYYVDVQDIRNVIVYDEKTQGLVVEEDGSDAYNLLVDKMEAVLNPYEITDAEGTLIPTEEKRIYAPNVVIVEKGEAIAMDDGVASSLEDPFGEITSEMQKEMKDEISALLEKLPDDGVCTPEKC